MARRFLIGTGRRKFMIGSPFVGKPGVGRVGVGSPAGSTGGGIGVLPVFSFILLRDGVSFLLLRNGVDKLRKGH